MSEVYEKKIAELEALVADFQESAFQAQTILAYVLQQVGKVVIAKEVLDQELPDGVGIMISEGEEAFVFSLESGEQPVESEATE